MPEQEYADVQFIINDLSSRLRSLENKYNLITERLLVINKNMIDEYKILTKEINSNNSEIRELKTEIEKLKSTMHDLLSELEYFAKKEDVKVLEKYINLWDPLKFATEEDVERILKNRLKEVKNAK
ncbi:hypothetical protein HYT58_01540 [Candidatus Woesearchaeota archaeon]|nr:hypothetical protein [Candidatus Woesearchaeota archaeon]